MRKCGRIVRRKNYVFSPDQSMILIHNLSNKDVFMSAIIPCYTRLHVIQYTCLKVAFEELVVDMMESDMALMKKNPSA